MGNNILQCLNLISREENPKIYTLDFNKDNLKVLNLELKFLQEINQKIRSENNLLTKKIESNYRRVGKYFDEILLGE